jgi:hypothetical protein
MAKLIEVMAILPRATEAKVCKQFGYWTEAMVETGGNFFIEIDLTCISAHYL